MEHGHTPIEVVNGGLVALDVILECVDILLTLVCDHISLGTEGFGLRTDTAVQDGYAVEVGIGVSFIGSFKHLAVGRGHPTGHSGRGSGKGKPKVV